MKKFWLMLLLLNATSCCSMSSLEEYLQRNNSYTPVQKVGIKIGCAIAFWATLSISSELIYLIGWGLSKANRAVINNSTTSLQKAWHTVVDESSDNDNKIKTFVKVIVYCTIAALPIGICYLAIS